MKPGSLILKESAVLRGRLSSKSFQIFTVQIYHILSQNFCLKMSSIKNLRSVYVYSSVSNMMLLENSKKMKKRDLLFPGLTSVPQQTFDQAIL